MVWALQQKDDTLQYKVLAELPYGSLEDAGTEDSLLKIRMKVDRPKTSNRSKSVKVSLMYPDKYYDGLLCKYFRLEVDLEDACNEWKEAHPHFRQISTEKAIAIRQLDQDPVENLFSFICSQNNHITRIASLVDRLCVLYGQHIVDLDGESYYNFPAVTKLATPGVENTLREKGFGYRAKFINKSAQEICEKGGLKWFLDLQSMDYKPAHDELMSLTGIGPKVSDCICLMSLGHLSAIPVDTHIFKIAQENYMKDLKPVKTVTPTIYNQIGDKFREVYGPLAGWAQTVLFCADLRRFQGTAEAKKSSRKRKGK